jgi:hypothetical protein
VSAGSPSLRLGALALQAAALAYLAAGKVGFEPRLALGALSANQILQAAVLAAAGVALVRMVRPAAPRARALGLVVALTVLLAAGMLHAVNRGYAESKLFGYALVVLPAMLVLSQWTRDERDVRRALALWACAGGVMMLLGMALLAAGRSPARLAVLGGGANVFARMVASALLAGVGVAGLHWRGRRAVVEVALLAGCAASLVFAGSKAVIVALGAALAARALCMGRPRQALACIAGAALFLAAPFVLHDLVRDADKHRGEVRMFQRPDLTDPEGSYTTRLQFVSQSLHLIGDRGLVGVGTGDWGPAVGRTAGRVYPHNWLLELWCELGLAGIAFAAVTLVWCARLVRRARGDATIPPVAATAVALAVFWLVNAQLSGDLLDNRNLWWSLLLLEVAAGGAAAAPAVPAPYRTRTMRSVRVEPPLVTRSS